MTTRTLSKAFGLALLTLGAAASNAAAAAAPECDTPETWDRPGLERTHELDCRRAWSVEPGSAPAHGTLSGFAYDADAQVASWRYRADDGAPASDAFTLRLEGPNGTATQRVAIHLTPRSQNTPPQCRPAEAAQRTAGTAPATVALDVSCWDYENDGFTIDGGGPGEHLDGPLTVPGGDAGGAEAPVWHYRTAIARGEEQTAIWATDDLGARSADAPLSVQVGPDVDRLPTCAPDIGVADPGASVLPVYARPGATRRFGVVCADADHDPLSVTLGTPPARGTMTKFAPSALVDRDWGSERWVDAVYRPADASGASDPFSVVAAGGGHSTETRMAIENADDPRWFSGLGCSTDAAKTTAGTPGLVHVACADDDGDDLTATVTRAPQHGAAARPLLSPAPYGWSDIAVAWTPAPGYVGIDTLGLRVSDGHGVQADISVDLYVYAGAAHSAALPASGILGVGQSKAISPLEQARRALGTRAVVLVRRLGDARVFARRRGPAARAGGKALAVTCPLRCRVDTRVKGGGRLARATARPGHAATLRLTRRAAGLLRTGGAAFELTARMPGGRTGRGTVRLGAR
jgi:hypothetical protein